MIRCNLSVLLAERNLKISTVSADTGISRTTLTALSTNRSQGIQFDTLNTLCTYLNVEPQKLILYIPFDIKIAHVHRDGSFIEIFLVINEKGKVVNCSIPGNVYDDLDCKRLTSVEISLTLRVEEEDSHITAENKVLMRAFQSFPHSFVKELKTEIINKILSTFDYANEDVEVLFYWPDELQ